MIKLPRVRWLRHGSAVAAASLICACHRGAAPSDAAFHPLSVGDTVASYRVATLHGDSASLGAGNEPTLLNVWATWCASCREEMQDLNALTAEYRGRGIRVIGVSIDEGGADRVQRFADAQHLAFTVGLDPSGDIQQAYTLVGVPTTMLIDRDGRLLWQHVGNLHEVLDSARQQLTRVSSEANTH